MGDLGRMRETHAPSSRELHERTGLGNRDPSTPRRPVDPDEKTDRMSLHGSQTFQSDVLAENALQVHAVKSVFRHLFSQTHRPGRRFLLNALDNPNTLR